MNQPNRYLNRMIVFVLVIAALSFFLFIPLQTAFMANAGLNGFILATFVVGIIFVFRQVTSLKPEIEWVESYKSGRNEGGDEDGPKLLAPMAALLGERRGATKLSALSMRSLLDSIGARLDEGREISRYMIGLLIFLGLLGTFWGLLGTIGAISGTIASLTVETNELGTMFEDLKAGLQSPLMGMATAFSSSLFGLAGSVALGFLDLQAGQAQNRFYNDLEEWLSSQSRLSSAAAIEGTSDDSGGGSSAFVGALLEQSADSLDKIGRMISKSEEGRRKTSDVLVSLAEQQALLSDQLKANQDIMAKLAQGQLAMSAALERFTDAPRAQPSGPAIDEATKGHLRNMDVHLKNLLEAQRDGREAMMDELRSEIKLLARTLASAIDSTNKGN
jgi:hypothetical protein